MLQGAQIGSIHTLKDLGLYMKVGSPTISGAEPETMLVNVPGSDFMLDLSRALDGEVHYKQRTIKMELLCKAKKSQWSTIQSALENALQGRWLRCTFDEDSTWYWLGLWRVDVVERGRTEITFSIEGTCNPYKRNITADAGADWLWDTFDFETDIIYDEPTGVISL